MALNPACEASSAWLALMAPTICKGRSACMAKCQRVPAEEVFSFIVAYFTIAVNIRDTIDVDKPRQQNTMLARSEEHTSELQSLMRTSYAVFCLKKKNQNSIITHK